MRGRGRATVLDDLPDWIVVEEILVRLPPKDLLRCRAVRKCWRRATSTDKFMLDHHRRQPLLPILSHVVDWQNRHLFVSRDTGANQQRLCPVLRFSDNGTLLAALDGLLIVLHGSELFICNPVTRKCAPLGKPQSRQGFNHQLAGFYRHQPSGEYRVLWGSSPTYYYTYDTNCRTFYYVLAVGSDNPRCIPRPVVSSPSLDLALRYGLPSSSGCPPVHHRGSLHWILVKYPGCDDSHIMVFNTAAETFRLICRPAQLHQRGMLLLEMDGTLTLCNISSDKHTIDVWGIQDYDVGTWFLKHRINLSRVDPSPPVQSNFKMFPRMTVLNEGELLVQFTPRPRHVLRYGIGGKFLGYLQKEEDQEINLWITNHHLKESVIPLPLFHEMREEDGAIQEPPFFIGL